MKPQTTHYQPEPSNIELMEIRNADSPEEIEIPTMIEVDEDQYQPPLNQGSCHSTRTT